MDRKKDGDVASNGAFWISGWCSLQKNKTKTTQSAIKIPRLIGERFGLTGWFVIRWCTLWLLFHHPKLNPQQKSAMKMPIKLSTTKLCVIAKCPASWAVNII